MTNGRRDYKRELSWEKKKKPNRVKDRAQRNAARSTVAKKAGKKPTEIKGDVGHKKAVGKGGGNGLANLFVQSPSANRSFSRNKNGSMKSENLKNLTLVDVLKFVVATEEDLAEFKRIYEQDLVCTYVLSPVFGAIEPKALVEFIKENKMNNAMVQVQLHKIIWDPNERGV